MVNSDGIVTATFPTPGGRPRYDGHDRDRRRAWHGGGGRPRLRGLGRRRERVPDRQRHRHLRRHPGDLRGQRDAGRRGGRGQLRQDRAGVGRRAGGRRGAEPAGPGTAARRRARRWAWATSAPPRSRRSRWSRRRRTAGRSATRTFIPVRVHESIGVLGAVSVGTAIMVPGAVGSDLAVLDGGQPAAGDRAPERRPRRRGRARHARRRRRR